MSDSDMRRATMTAVLCVTAACGDLPRTNPLDPGTTIALTVSGPDTATAVGDTLTFTLASDPDYSHGPVAWSSTGYLKPIPGQPGRFVVVAGTRSTSPEIVTATLDGRTATRTVHVVQRPASMRLSISGTPPAATLEYRSPGEGSRLVFAQVFDRRGNWFWPPDPPVATFSSGGVVSASVEQHSEDKFLVVAPRAIGTTQMVVTRAGFRDSLLVRVHQLVKRIETEPAECQYSYPRTVIGVGDTLRLRPTNRGFDIANLPVADTALVRTVASRLQWRIIQNNFNPPILAMPENGVVVGLSQGFAVVHGYETSQPLDVVAEGVCFIKVR